MKREQLKWSVATAGNVLIGLTTGNLESQWVNLQGKRLEVSLKWTGTTAGTLTVERSNDGGVTVSGTYSINDFTPNLANPAGSASSTEGGITYPLGGWYKVKFTVSAGTGGLTGTILGKAA